MKYIVILGDGMADLPLEELGGKTPLEYAETPAMDALAACGTVGLVQNVPAGMVPGSDVANLSVLGYDPWICYTGRAPLEALSLGIPMEDTDIILRCNFVTVSADEPYEEKRILDHSAGELTTHDAAILMDAVRAAFDSDEFRFYTGTGYRQICVWKNGRMPELTPPYDCLGERIGANLPQEPALREMMERSFTILNGHPLNIGRTKKANSLWFWGAGTKPKLKKFPLRGAMISGVDLLKGIAVAAGMEVVGVPGATGRLDTNYEGKANGAVNALRDGADFVYVHLEAPDEMGHQGDAGRKVKAIENLDSRIVAPIRQVMDAWGEPYKMLILPDHPTPVSLRCHTADPVPFLLYDSRTHGDGVSQFSEKTAASTGLSIPRGHQLLKQLVEA